MMKVLGILLLVAVARLSCFANDSVAGKAEVEAFNQAWNRSYQSAAELYPDAANENSALTKAVRADIEAIRTGPDPQLLSNPALPMILVQKHAARLGISPRTSAGVEKAPAVPVQSEPMRSADDEARIIQLMLAGISRDKAESLVIGRGRAATAPQDQGAEDRIRMERDAKLRDDQLRDSQRQTDDALTRERRQAELDRDRIDRQRLDQQRHDRQLRDERLRRETQEAERQRARDRN